MQANEISLLVNLYFLKDKTFLYDSDVTKIH